MPNLNIVPYIIKAIIWTKWALLVLKLNILIGKFNLNLPINENINPIIPPIKNAKLLLLYFLTKYIIITLKIPNRIGIKIANSS